MTDLPRQITATRSGRGWLGIPGNPHTLRGKSLPKDASELEKKQYDPSIIGKYTSVSTEFILWVASDHIWSHPQIFLVTKTTSWKLPYSSSSTCRFIFLTAAWLSRRSAAFCSCLKRWWVDGCWWDGKSKNLVDWNCLFFWCQGWKRLQMEKRKGETWAESSQRWVQNDTESKPVFNILFCTQVHKTKYCIFSQLSGALGRKSKLSHWVFPSIHQSSERLWVLQRLWSSFVGSTIKSSFA